MAKDKAGADQAPETAEVGEFPLSIDEFCIGASKTDGRVALLSAFASEMRRAGKSRALASEYAAELVKFAGAPA